MGADEVQIPFIQLSVQAHNGELAADCLANLRYMHLTQIWEDRSLQWSQFRAA